MKVAIVNCFDTYEERVNLLHKYFKDKGYKVSVIQSDFRHFKKEKRKNEKKDFIFIDTKPYFRNMSIGRMKSHYVFAKDAFKVVEEIEPNILYVLLPPNSLAKFASKYKNKNNKVKLYFDIIDLWPETMPIGGIKLIPPFIYWRNLRDKHMTSANFIITECNLYKSVMKKTLAECNVETIYLSRLENKVETRQQISNDEVNLCYLGSINNIIDIEKIKIITSSINKIKQTTLHIIGDGEKKQTLIDEINSTGAKVEYHGKVYETNKKQEIFNKCHFGLNIMKDSVCVGLTMKSIDYFQYGLPIINNIKKDTFDLVNKYKIGININNDNIEEFANKIAAYDIETIMQMKQNTQQVFDELFSYEAFSKKLDEVMEGNEW